MHVYIFIILLSVCGICSRFLWKATMRRLQATFIRSSPGFMEEVNQKAEVGDKRNGGRNTPTRQGRLAESPVYLFDKGVIFGVRDTLLSAITL
ncbi:hypothetical protein VN97_g12309 [Penicillium thymicola]|uniref:Uncharacterized protein n=1 Tax=Penicillium thymicola TaxID=293382 RepID=A0AAI9T6A1_PENTH|nr:hypothetical protein VN97_g12309 [Penicillium thymicola]